MSSLNRNAICIPQVLRIYYVDSSMRIAIFVAGLVFGVTAFANGPDEWQLFGISKEGRKVFLTYGGYDLEQKNKGISTYLDQNRPAYGFCEAGASATEGEYFLYCSQTLGGKPDLIYKKDAGGKATAHYREAKRLYNRQFRGKIPGYYRCIEGCERGVAKFLFEFNSGD